MQVYTQEVWQIFPFFFLANLHVLSCHKLFTRIISVGYIRHICDILQFCHFYHVHFHCFVSVSHTFRFLLFLAGSYWWNLFWVWQCKKCAGWRKWAGGKVWCHRQLFRPTNFRGPCSQHYALIMQVTKIAIIGTSYLTKIDVRHEDLQLSKLNTRNEEKSQKISTCIRIHTRVYANRLNRVKVPKVCPDPKGMVLTHLWGIWGHLGALKQWYLVKSQFVKNRVTGKNHTHTYTEYWV